MKHGPVLRTAALHQTVSHALRLVPLVSFFFQSLNQI